VSLELLSRRVKTVKIRAKNKILTQVKIQSKAKNKSLKKYVFFGKVKNKIIGTSKETRKTSPKIFAKLLQIICQIDPTNLQMSGVSP